MQLSHLDLFSGIGGFALAAQMVGGIKTQQFVEINQFCQKVLAKNFSGVPIHEDITTFTTKRRFDLVTGGFPCQDISSANVAGEGLDGERSGLFYELIRIVRECRPRYIVLENVSALLSKRSGRDMGAVLWELSACGYDAEWSSVSACAMGAPHTRERVFIVAHANRINVQGMAFQQPFERQVQPTNHRALPQVWSSNSIPSRVSDGVPDKVDRLRGLGNAVVPQCAAVALSRVLGLEEALSTARRVA